MKYFIHNLVVVVAILVSVSTVNVNSQRRAKPRRRNYVKRENSNIIFPDSNNLQNQPGRPPTPQHGPGGRPPQTQHHGNGRRPPQTQGFSQQMNNRGPPQQINGFNQQNDFGGQQTNNRRHQRPPPGFSGGDNTATNWYGPHRPHADHYRDFSVVFKDIDRKAAPNESLDGEDDDINEDFNGRSIVSPGQYPHMAAIGFRSSTRDVEFKCGGSLISDLFVLTAAHCCSLNGQAPQVIKIGDIKLKEREPDSEPQRRRVAQVILHPNYNSSLHYNDIALIQLNRPIEHTRFVRPIRLWANDNIPYEKVFTMGYGSTKFAAAPTNILTELDLSIVPLTTCNSQMTVDEDAPYGIVESQICAKDFEQNRDTCQGDSGGPLQLNLERRRRRRLRYYLVGIISYGQFCGSSSPGIYTRVSSYIDWIAPIVWPDYFHHD